MKGLRTPHRFTPGVPSGPSISGCTGLGSAWSRGPREAALGLCKGQFFSLHEKSHASSA